jgi:glucose-1-phosphate thymidylyltransferase
VKLVVLAAGYATRLCPLTLDRPKALLPVAGRPMLEHVLESLAGIADLDGAYLVTNAKFAETFRAWASAAAVAWPITIVDDGTTDDVTKLGAIGDLDLVITQERLDDDVVVVAGDNLFSERLDEFGRFARSKDAPVLAVYDVGSLDEMRKYNAITMDGEGRITFFEEKPERPASTVTGIALYYYPRNVLPLLRRYVEEGNNPDQPGRLVQWLYPQLPFYTWRVPGVWYDIGSEETLREADRVFSGREAGSTQA